MTVIADYRTQVADLLHDPSNVIWSATQLDRYINEARRQLVMDTGCLRSLQDIFCTQAEEAYTFGQVTGGSILSGGSNYTAPTVSFSGGGGTGVAATLGVTDGAVTSISFTNFGSGYTSAPSASILDATGTGAAIQIGAVNVNTYEILGIALIWGSMRYPLQWRAWSVFSTIMRSWVNQQRQPAMWAVYGDTQFYLGPLPDQTYECEVDSLILPTDISGVNIDPIPAMLQDPIKFYAAHLAKDNQQLFGEAQMFRKKYQERMLECQAAYMRRIPNLVSTATSTP